MDYSTLAERIGEQMSKQELKLGSDRLPAGEITEVSAELSSE
jgi:hypothetical protein